MHSQVIIRIVVFAVVFIVLGVMEVVIPDRKAVHSRLQRWPGNLLILLIGNGIGRMMTPLLPFAAALFSLRNDWGLCGIGTVPFWIKIVITVLILDFWVYLQHLLFHKISGLRALHRMHHTDTHLDVTSALRFHPLEILISILYKSALVLALGLEPLGVAVFEILLNSSAMFNHANIRLSPRLDAVIRLLIVTPDFHRIHHSRIKEERNSNYGFFLSFWDRIFSTYIKEPSGDIKTFPLGITGYSRAVIHRLDKLLIDPFYSRGIRDE